ncbi:uncharacterized protein TNCV_3342731 [Trichonephila clavipes]|nr:uncharacterized protein TNCV_3342731 [Trichonephila clavipes]
MLNDGEIVTSVKEESDPVDYETDGDEDNNKNERSKGALNANAFSALQTAMEWHEQQSECCATHLLLLKRKRDLFFPAKKRRCTMACVLVIAIEDLVQSPGAVVQQPMRPRPTVSNSVFVTSDTEVHEQMFRSDDQSDAKPSSVWYY